MLKQIQGAFGAAKQKATHVIDNATGVVTAVGTGLATTAGSAMAAPVDVTPLTSAIDYSTVIVAILAVGAIMVEVYIAWKATKMVLGATKTL